MAKRNVYGYGAPEYGTPSRRSSGDLPLGLILVVFVIVCIAVVYVAGGMANFVYDLYHPMVFLNEVFMKSGLGK